MAICIIYFSREHWILVPFEAHGSPRHRFAAPATLGCAVASTLPSARSSFCCVDIISTSKRVNVSITFSCDVT